MSTIEQESLIEKPFVNGSQEMNAVVKAIDDQEAPIANKENIQIEENKIINTDENRNPERTQEVRDEDKITHTKEAKIYIDDAAAADADRKQLIKNGTENVTHEADRIKSQNNSVEEYEGSKNVNIKYDTDKNDEDSIVEGIKPVKDTQPYEKSKNDSLKENKIIENVDVDQEATALNNEVKETNSNFKKTLQENSHEVTVPVVDSLKTEESKTIPHKTTNESSEAILGLNVEYTPACPNDGETVREEIAQTSTVSEYGVHSIMESESMSIFTGDNSDFKEPSVNVADVSDEIIKNDTENTEIVKEKLDHGDVTEVMTAENNNSAQLTEDVEMVSTECNINDNGNVNTEEKNVCAQIADAVEMVSLEDKNKDDADIQSITKMDISDNGDKATTESSKNNEIDVKDKHKDDSYSRLTTSPIVSQNENKDISISLNNVNINSLEDTNNSENINETKDHNTSTVTDIVDLDEVKIVEDDHKKDLSDKNEICSVEQKVEEKKICPATIRLSNTLDILSDDDEEPVQTNLPELSKVDIQKVASSKVLEKCINLDDDDDIMLIDDVTSNNDKQIDPNMTTESGKLDIDADPVESNEIEGSKMSVTSSDLGKSHLIIIRELCF